MILEETFTLANGVTIPKLGLGTWMIEDGKVADAVRSAVSIGYRHIDTAQAYANERGVGEGCAPAASPAATSSSPPSSKPTARLTRGKGGNRRLLAGARRWTTST